MAERIYTVRVPTERFGWPRELVDTVAELAGWLSVRLHPRPEVDRLIECWDDPPMGQPGGARFFRTDDPELATVLTTWAEFGWEKAWEVAQEFIRPDSLTAMRFEMKREAS